MNKSIRIFCLIFLLSTALPAQITLDSKSQKRPLVKNIEVKALRADEGVSLEVISQSNLWQPYDSTYIATPQNSVWLKFSLTNPDSDTTSLYLHSLNDLIDVYKQNSSGIEHFKNGTFRPLRDRPGNNEPYFTEISLFPSQTALCYVKLSNSHETANTNYPYLYSESLYLKKIRDTAAREAKSIGFIYFYLITLICIFIFVIVFWLRLRQRLYFYYSGYLFFQILFALTILSLTSATVGNIFLHIPFLSRVFVEPFQFIFIGFYIFFILNLLEIKKFDALLARILYHFGAFCFGYAVARFLFDYFWVDLEIRELIFTVIRLIVLPVNFVLIFWIIYRAKHPLLKYFIFGQSVFFIGSILSSYVAYADLSSVPGGFFNFPYSPNIIFQIGLLAEVFFFSIAIGENIFLIQKQQEQTSQKLISQLQKNRVLQENMNIELDKKVSEKTEELIQLYSRIEKQKEEQIKNSFTKRIQDMEMLALRAQMNPHFIFNSLNALKNLIMLSRIDDAVLYLDDFSILLRSILQNSTKDVITVEEELEILELYLSLEKNRMGENFNYSIKLMSKGCLSQYAIPPLLLQPFVENAIWHGLNASEKIEKNLKITFDTMEHLKIIIEDNGIGRKASDKFKKMYKSMGTDITKERLSLFNHTNDAKISLNILDLKEHEIPSGTRITFIYNH